MRYMIRSNSHNWFIINRDGMADKAEQVQNYIYRYSSHEDPVLDKLYRETHLKTIYPQMISGPLQGKLLEFISRMICPEYILEIGTFTGYSAICLAKGLSETGKLLTIEINDELKKYSQKYFKESGLSSKIQQITGNATDIIPTLSQSFDLIFIDADKKEYIRYYQMSLEKLATGGYLIIDNVLWGNKVPDENRYNDSETLTIRKLNDIIHNDPRVENIILPIRDGINLVRKK